MESRRCTNTRNRSRLTLSGSRRAFRLMVSFRPLFLLLVWVVTGPFRPMPGRSGSLLNSLVTFLQCGNESRATTTAAATAAREEIGRLSWRPLSFPTWADCIISFGAAIRSLFGGTKDAAGCSLSGAKRPRLNATEAGHKEKERKRLGETYELSFPWFSLRRARN